MERKINHCVYNINYHIVFCPKYRHSVITRGIAETIVRAVQEICDAYGYDLVQMETMPDHLHIFPLRSPDCGPNRDRQAAQKHHR